MEAGVSVLCYVLVPTEHYLHGYKEEVGWPESIPKVFTVHNLVEDGQGNEEFILKECIQKTELLSDPNSDEDILGVNKEFSLKVGTSEVREEKGGGDKDLNGAETVGSRLVVNSGKKGENA